MGEVRNDISITFFFSLMKQHNVRIKLKLNNTKLKKVKSSWTY